MFKNSGAKLKIIAVVLMILQMIGCIAAAVVCFTKEEPDILMGILSIVGGFFLAWFEALTLYAIGVSAEAADRTAESIDETTRRMNAIDRKLELILDQKSQENDRAQEKKKEKSLKK